MSNICGDIEHFVKKGAKDGFKPLNESYLHQYHWNKHHIFTNRLVISYMKIIDDLEECKKLLPWDVDDIGGGKKYEIHELHVESTYNPQIKHKTSI